MHPAVLAIGVVAVASTAAGSSGAAHVVRVLSGVGFHRNLTVTMSGLGPRRCTVAVLQPLPRALYVDELRTASGSDVGPPLASVTLFVQQRVEALAERVGPQTVLLSAPSSTGSATMWLRVHTRYHRAVPAGREVQPVPLPPPRLFMDCRDSVAPLVPRPCSVSAGAALDLVQCEIALRAAWQSMAVDTTDGVAVANVTRGNTDSLWGVAVGTIVATGAAFVWVAYGVAAAAGISSTHPKAS
mmetsp:Transcript_7550/g.19469  ORF Transcript_7550/g.19469 Transcript_7550/m.19469 type:complete len:242 (+) Transcript_7550:215-940(+)